MAKKNQYVPLWESYMAYFEPLDAAEIGHLVLAMMQYKASGAQPELNGNERFVWPAIRRDIDEASAAYEKICVRNSQNGAKGGRPPKPEESESEPENPVGFLQTGKSQGKEKGKGKSKEQEAGGARAEKPIALICRCYEDNMGALPRSIGDEAQSWLDSGMDADLICAAIEEAAAHNARSWAYVRTVLQGFTQRGVTSRAAFNGEKTAKAQKRAVHSGGQNANPFLEMVKHDTAGST